MADSLYIRYGMGPPRHPYSPMFLSETMWIEWKRVVKGKATKLTPKQLEWHQLERARGGYTLRAGMEFDATIEGFYEFYKKSGLMIKMIRMPLPPSAG